MLAHETVRKQIYKKAQKNYEKILMPSTDFRL